VDRERKMHGVLCLNPGDGVEGDRWLGGNILRSLWNGGLLVEGSHGRDLSRNVVIEEIRRL
jgi:hypothetical protein